MAIRLSATLVNILNQSSADCFSTEGFGTGIMFAVITGGVKDMVAAGAAEAAAGGGGLSSSPGIVTDEMSVRAFDVTQD